MVARSQRSALAVREVRVRVTLEIHLPTIAAGSNWALFGAFAQLCSDVGMFGSKYFLDGANHVLTPETSITAICFYMSSCFRQLDPHTDLC